MRRRKKKQPPRYDWFRAWWDAMPLDWKSGLDTAIRGGAFMGDLENRQTGALDCVVFFVHGSLADKVRSALEAGS